MNLLIFHSTQADIIQLPKPILEQPTLIQSPPKQPNQKIQRTILSLYFDDQNDEIQYHPIHITFDMPLIVNSINNRNYVL